MDEYISKQRAKDLMGCCLTSAKANYKAETSVFKKEQFKHYAETIEAMIDVVGAVEAADAQLVKRGKWIWKERHRNSYRIVNGTDRYFKEGDLQIHEEYKEKVNYCSVCGKQGHEVFLNFCPNCGARMDGEQDG